MQHKISQLLKKGQFSVNGSLWLEGDGVRFFGPGPVELLQLIQETGSINAAAKKMQMSYKKAWHLVNNLNAMSAQPMIITATGGEKGGGSSISEEALQLIDYHRRLRERFKKFLEEETRLLK